MQNPRKTPFVLLIPASFPSTLEFKNRVLGSEELTALVTSASGFCGAELGKNLANSKTVKHFTFHLTYHVTKT